MLLEFANKELVVLIRINSETDFAAKSETFLSFLDDLGQFALSLSKPGIKEDFLI